MIYKYFYGSSSPKFEMEPHGIFKILSWKNLLLHPLAHLIF